LGREVGDPTAAPLDPTLSRFLERLREVKSPLRAGFADAVDLYFLRPADQPGLLGMLGHYEVSEAIGHGGMGIVLKAYDPTLHRFVAIKVLAAAVAGSATARRRFTREAQACASVAHEHVVTVHGVHETDGLPYLVMQYVPGESLQARLDRTGPLDTTEVVRIGMQTAAGLAAAHAQGLIQRDIKPANLRLENGLARIKITDFGLARMADDVQLTQNGVVAGTPEYMAPEQARGESVDHRADLFSLGSVLYAMCTGHPPFRGSSALAVLRQVSEHGAVSVRSLNPDTPAWLETVISGLMAKDPADRFQSAAEVADLLEGYLAHLRQPTSVALPAIPARFAWRLSSLERSLSLATSRSQSQRRLWAGGLVLLFAMMLWSLLMMNGAGNSEGRLRGEQVYDFRGASLPTGMSPLSPDPDQFVKVEAEGLRIRLPKDRTTFYPATFSMPVAIEGDFEITTGFEIVHADMPAPGARSYGLGVLMSLNEIARVGCLWRAEGPVVSWDRWDIMNGDRKFLVGAMPCMSSKGRLRLKRTDNNLVFSWSPESEGDQFHAIHQCDFGKEDIKEFRLELTAGLGGGRRGELDVRLIELRIRASNPGADQLLIPPEQRAGQLRDWLVTGLILGLLVSITIPVGWMFVRRGRRVVDPSELTAGAAKLTTTESPAPTLAVRCAGCGKVLKGKPELAGKKVRCSACGQSVCLPDAETGRSGADSV
jgi:serine/threonine protein kinase